MHKTISMRIIFMLYFIITLAFGFIPTTSVSKERQTVEIIRKSKKVLKYVSRIGGPGYCLLITDYKIIKNSTWVCNNFRLGGACLSRDIKRHPNYSQIKRTCPRICGGGYWKGTRTRSEFWRDVAVDCTGAVPVN